MTCVHLRQLYHLCQENQLQLSSSDLIRIVCHQCNEQAVCPSVLTDEHEARARQTGDKADFADVPEPPSSSGCDAG